MIDFKLSRLYYFETQMSQDETLQHTINREAIQPKKILEEIEASKQQSFPNDSGKLDQPKMTVQKSNSENSLNNVNLADSILPDNGEIAESGQRESQLEQIPKIKDDFFYDDGHVQFIHPDSPIPQAVVKLDGFYGHDSFKRYNALALDRDTIIYAAGISYTIFNHFTKDKKQFYSKDRGGIGSIAVHPSKRYFAVAQMGAFPNIYIYEYPSLKLYRILRKGTERSYSSIIFSGSGEYLASVGSEPDYLLTVWDWKQERLLLKSKAFSQQVYRVSFSQFNQNWLTTSGTGHIRFWKISQTFTGLKLQGDIAKFGQFELSDVCSFAEYEDGNVLSSSQYGKLLLWEGNLIKSVVSISPDKSCHQGQIQFVRHYNKKIITAGADGYIRFWDAQAINQGQSDQKFNFYIKPERQIYFETQNKQPAYINWIEIQNDYWIVQDALGSLWKYNPENDKRDLILSFNSGKFNDFAISPLNNCLATAGNDGAIRLWDYGNRKQFYSRKFVTKSQATSIDWLPFSKRNSGRMLVVGFSDGIVRFVGLQDKKFSLVKAFKVHKNPITKVKCNRQGNIVVVCDSSGSLFFLALDDVTLSKITPYCLFETGFKINDMSWDRSGDKILLACQDGKLHEISVPKQKDCDYSETYLRKFNSKTITVKMMDEQKPNKEQLQLELLLKKTKGAVVDEVVLDEEWDPAPIMNASYYNQQCNKIICTVQGNFLGRIYIVDFNKQRPVGSMQIPKLKTSFLAFNESTQMIFIGYKNGSWELRHKYQPSNLLRKYCFDQNYGIVKKMALNIQNTAIISASEDGTMLVHKFDYSTFIKGAKGQYIDSVQISIPTVLLGISAANFSDKIDFGKDDGDISDNSIYSLQDQKLKAEEDTKLTEAEKVKIRKMKKIRQLQDNYKQIKEANNSETDNLARLTPEDLIVDPQYTAAFQKRVDEQEEETRKELAWDEEYAETKKRKLQDYFINNLEFDKFNVKGIKKDIVVSSFKMSKLTGYIQKELQQIQKIIQQEQLSSHGQRRDKTVSNFEASKAMLQLKIKDTKKGGKQENQQVKNKIRQAQTEFEKELAQAIATKGDYKLKCAPDYMVPQNERLNVSRKKKHLFLHYQYLFEEKKEFNKRLESLRLKKKQLVDKLEPVNDRLRKINKELGVQEEDILFQIDEDIELIETQIEVTEEQIAEHLLQKQKQKEASKKTGGMGMASTEDKQQKNNDTQKVKKPKKKKIFEKKEQKNVIQIKPRANLKVKKSVIEDELRQIKRIKLQAQKQKLRQGLFSEIAQFDNELENLKGIKYHLQSDLNLVEMKILTYSQEFIIFRDMETYDMQLMEQLKTLGSEKTNLQATYLQLSTQIGEVEILNEQFKRKYEQQKKILRQFVYPDDDQMRERIIRYYKIRERKRINKLKKQAELEQKQKENEENEDQDDQQEEQEDSDESEDQFEDQDEKPDITVIENDHKNFERVRKICQYDEKIQQYSKKKSDLQKQRNQINTKIKNISTSLSTAEKQLKVYQKKKLLKINQVYVSLPTSFSQIQYTVKLNNRTRLQQDFSNAIFFTKGSFNRLGERIVQLEKQTIDICKKETNLKKKLTKLVEQVQKASSTIESKRKEYEQKQLLKFGNTFELQKLKELEPNDQVLQMRDLYKKQQCQVSKRIQKIKEQLQQRKRELLQSKKQNTKVINDITDLGERQNQLKKKLDSTNKQLFKNYDVSKKDELEKERQNLKDLIKFLSKQIEDLKTQIGLFKRKGGHIYTMVTSNKKNFS